jgi:hypothetical protein
MIKVPEEMIAEVVEVISSWGKIFLIILFVEAPWGLSLSVKAVNIEEAECSIDEVEGGVGLILLPFLSFFFLLLTASSCL